MRPFIVLFLLMAAWLGGASAALAQAADSEQCVRAIAAAEHNLKTPDRLLSAIGLVESGRADPKTGTIRPWPWTINAEGNAHYFDSKVEAIAAVQALQTRGVRSIDVGCMQVNLMHHPTAFASLDEAFDPNVNATYAARFLLSLYHDLGSWPRATAAYHSQTDELGTDYARRVMMAWGRPNLMPMMPMRRSTEALFAAFSASSAQYQYRAFAPQSALFGAFATAGSAPLTLRGYSGLPLHSHKARRTVSVR
ncbi:MAG: transglycosylase SLT domain-containing protein [Acetobacteraceae bacterium]|nr:transglycosylase SLT domain-containing protein [Acetobacteraceae bacterium]